METTTLPLPNGAPWSRSLDSLGSSERTLSIHFLKYASEFIVIFSLSRGVQRRTRLWRFSVFQLMVLLSALVEGNWGAQCIFGAYKILYGDKNAIVLRDKEFKYHTNFGLGNEIAVWLACWRHCLALAQVCDLRVLVYNFTYTYSISVGPCTSFLCAVFLLKGKKKRVMIGWD